MNQKKIGRRIQEYRRHWKMSQEDLAVAAEISTYHMGSIETGKKGPSLSVLVKIANTLDVTTDYLLTGSTRHRKSIQVNKLSTLMDGCTEREYQMILSLLEIIKSILHETTHHKKNGKVSEHPKPRGSDIR